MAHSVEKNHFCPKNDKFGLNLTQFLTDRKHGQSLETSFGHGFHGSITKRSLQNLCKNYPKVHGQTKAGEGGGGRTIAPLNYATVGAHYCFPQFDQFATF